MKIIDQYIVKEKIITFCWFLFFGEYNQKSKTQKWLYYNIFCAILTKCYILPSSNIFQDCHRKSTQNIFLKISGLVLKRGRHLFKSYTVNYRPLYLTFPSFIIFVEYLLILSDQSSTSYIMNFSTFSSRADPSAYYSSKQAIPPQGIIFG